LHHDFVSTLLDHLFGIQNRSGCSCAGPYGHRLLGIDPDVSVLYRARIARGLLRIKPGWVRFSLPYYASEQEVDFVLRSIEFIADHGDSFLPLYHLGWHDGIWQHIEHPMLDVQPIELTSQALRDAATEFCSRSPEPRLTGAEVDRERALYLDEAHRIAAELEARWQRDPPVYRTSTGNPDIDPLIWFRFVHAT